MKVLHIDCSVRGDRSISRELSALFVNQIEDQFGDAFIDYIDLDTAQPKEISSLFISANYCPPDERTVEMKEYLKESDQLIERLEKADVYVIGMPMHNFSIPSNFKIFVDNIVRNGMTFHVTEKGSEGLLKNKKVYVINTRGLDFSNEIASKMDHLVPYLRTAFGFIGIDQVHFINVYPVKWGSPEVLSDALRKAKAEISRHVRML